ncbi:MAG: YCF48-related protein, partial [Betaproteobacteria bacterium]
QRAVAVGNDGVALYTGDGGATWHNAEVPKSSVVNKLVRVKAQAEGLGYAIGEYNAILKSIDYGKTWERLTPQKDVVWYGFDVVGKKILVVGEFGRTLVSFDEGTMWKEVQTPTKVHLTGAAFKSEQEAVLVGLNGTVMQTSNGGGRWKVIQTGFDEHIYDVIWDGSQYLACGDRGLLVTSADGSKWSTLDSGLDSIQRNYLWFMQIRKFGQGFLLAGSNLALVENKQFRDLSVPASVQSPASAVAK